VRAKRRLKIFISMRDVWICSGDVQDDNAYADTGFAGVAFALAAPFEGRAVALVVGDFLLGCALLDAAAVPHGDCDEGGKPEDRVDDVDGEEGKCVCEACGAGPHGDHDEVDYGWYREEALYAELAFCSSFLSHCCQRIALTYQSKIIPSRTARLSILCEDCNGDA
jgi:hypothetical protein